jgi:hypothetical protein
MLKIVDFSDNTRYSNRGRTPSVNTHTTRSNINTPMFLDGKNTMWGNIYGPNQCGHLRKFFNAKEKYFTR